MRIQVIIPASDPQFLREHKDSRIAYAKGFAEVEVINLPKGPESIETSEDEALATIALIDAVKQAEQKGFHGVTIDCAADPGLRALKESVSIPLCGAGEASYLTAMALCDRFSVVAVVDNTAHIIRENIRKYGLSQRVASGRSAGIPVLELGKSEETISALEGAGRLAIADGAGALVLGCTGMSQAKEELEKRLGIPVINPAAASIQLLIALIMGKNTISKKDFPLGNTR